MVALQISPTIESFVHVWIGYTTHKINCKDLYGILQLLRGSHLNKFPLKSLELAWVAFHSVTFLLKCLDFQSNHYNKLVSHLIKQ